MACIYNSFSEYLSTFKTVSDRIMAYDLLIDTLLMSVADHSKEVGVNIAEYQLDDGQVKIKTNYRSIQEIQSGINALEKSKQMWLNRLQGRVVVLKDVNSFRR